MDAMNDTYFEIIGTPIDGSTIRMVNCCNLGDHLSASRSLRCMTSLLTCVLVNTCLERSEARQRCDRADARQEVQREDVLIVQGVTDAHVV